MQFKHPEILWALLLLLIPVLVHLFQLRRFEKVPFTNVKFLKDVIIQTRKSSQIKKWLVLLTRMMIIAGLVTAFAQPYLANRDLATSKKETVIYLDNSFSMQAKGNRGPLMQRAIQDLVGNVPEDATFTLFTNDKTYPNTNIKAIRNELLQLQYTSNQLSLEAILLKGNNNFSETSTARDFIAISDFQQKQQLTSDLPLAKETTMRWVQLQPENTNNISIDSIYVLNTDPVNLELNIQLTSQNNNSIPVAVSLFDDGKLIGKTSVDFETSNTVATTFSIPAGKAIKGKVTIEDEALQFDNELFFNINSPEKIQVLTISENADNFLKRIYTQDEFKLNATTLDQLDYNLIPKQNLIVLNGLKSIPNSLTTALGEFSKNGGWIVVVPSTTIDIKSYNAFLLNANLGNFGPKISIEKRITNIVFDHPLFKDVFDERVKNFQYPKVNTSYSASKINASKVLNYEDGSGFLLQKGNYYLFTASIDKDNANFQNSPLIVPTLYNMGKRSLELPQLYYQAGITNNFDIKVSLQDDHILTIANTTTSFIPLQQTLTNKVQLTTDDLPSQAGIFDIKDKEVVLQQISYNYNRSESKLNYEQIETLTQQEVSTSVASMFDIIKTESKVNELWKWFAIFALLFLVIEMLILKFFK